MSSVFARPVSAKRLVRALAKMGARTFWITEAHAVAYLDEDNVEELSRGDAPSARVDVVSTVTEPEPSAIRTAEPPRSAPRLSTERGESTETT